ncbi:protein FAM200B-like [Stegodyphus dumicola]|uniref:protein FAM200B-like n=1 Tax=Stegodyphus dumicola TaxID=202533 RepID=UPI0015B1E8E7|nr:protein FAM200B-like [Stegodyphus dumicola]
MDCWLKSGNVTPKESNDYSSSQLIGNNEINDESALMLNEPTEKKARKTRKYEKEYLKFGFSWTRDENEPIQLCVICFENLANERLKPSILKRHFETNHN